jgi:uncharacterized membrane protein
MQELLRFFGHGFCHQIPARSFEAGGLVFSVCARDTGIYLGIFCALIAATVLYARSADKPAELPPTPFLIVLAACILPMAFDGASSYLGLRPTTNEIRYITGFLTGAAVGSVLAPLLFALRRDAAPHKRIFAKPREAILHLALAFLLGAAFLFGYPLLGVVAPFVGVVAFLTAITCVNLVLLALSRRFAPRHTLVHWLFLLVLSVLFALVEVALFGAARELFVQLLLGGHELHEFFPWYAEG